jgi:two-component system LytT family response regulator
MSAMSLRTLIVDDEAVARQGLRRMLESEADVEVIGEADTGRAAAEAISRHRPDLVFMDVQMPEMNGFEALASLNDAQLPVVIFVTAYDQYALRAFDVHAVDYLLKPFTQRRLHEALDRARHLHEAGQVAALRRQVSALVDRLSTPASDADASDASTPPRSEAPPSRDDSALRRIPIKKRHRVFFVDVEEVDWIEAADNYVKLHTGGDAHLVRAQLSEMEERLPSDLFLRIHRSTIVNVERIRELHPRGSGDCDLILHDGTQLRSSRTYSDRRREVLDLSA